MRGSHTVGICTAYAKPLEALPYVEKCRQLKELARESNGIPSIRTGSAHQLRDYAIIIALYWCNSFFGTTRESWLPVSE